MSCSSVSGSGDSACRPPSAVGVSLPGVVRSTAGERCCSHGCIKASPALGRWAGFLCSTCVKNARSSPLSKHGNSAKFTYAACTRLSVDLSLEPANGSTCESMKKRMVPAPKTSERSEKDLPETTSGAMCANLPSTTLSPQDSAASLAKQLEPKSATTGSRLALRRMLAAFMSLCRTPRSWMWASPCSMPEKRGRALASTSASRSTRLWRSPSGQCSEAMHHGELPGRGSALPSQKSPRKRRTFG
mmetsp:Transcript_66837/g.186767  ORF Transcript_66837/g.186767 Transcript_66837/m.186767 type:complete len:245 (+) Transcript_66837:3-737(+)